MSRELDAQIAEKVMGWKLRKMYATEDRLAWTKTHEDGDPEWVCWQNREPNYSTDIAAAWPILTKFINCEMEEWVDNFGRRNAICAVDHYLKGPPKHRSGIQPTMAMAICRAALAATQGEG